MFGNRKDPAPGAPGTQPYEAVIGPVTRRRLLVVELPPAVSDQLDTWVEGGATPAISIFVPGLAHTVPARFATRTELAALGMIGFADFLARRLGGP